MLFDVKSHSTLIVYEFPGELFSLCFLVYRAAKKEKQTSENTEKEPKTDIEAQKAICKNSLNVCSLVMSQSTYCMNCWVAFSLLLAD